MAKKKTPTKDADDALLGCRLVQDYCVYVVTESLKSGVAPEIDDDDFEMLKVMKQAIRDFINQRSMREFAYRHYIETQTDGSAEDADEYVDRTVDTLRNHDRSMLRD